MIWFPIIFFFGITLKEAVHHALSKNFQILSARHSTASALLSARGSWSAVLPRFSADFSLRRQLEVPEVEIMGRRFKAGTEEQRVLTLSVSESMPLDGSFFHIKNAKYAEYRTKLYSMENLKNEIVFSVANLYVSIAVLKKLVQISHDNVERMKKHLEVAQLLFENGIIPSVDLTRIETSYLSSRVQLKNVQIDFEKTMNQFLLLLGSQRNNLEISQNIDELISEFRPLEFFQTVKRKDKTDFSSGEKMWIEKSPDILALRWQVSQIDSLSKVERGKLFPLVSVGFSLVNSAGTFVEQRNIPILFAGVTLNIDSGGTLFSFLSLKEAKLSLLKQIEELKLKKTKEIAMILKEFELLTEKINFAKMQVSSAKKSHEYAEELFAEGKITSLELIDREFQLEQAQIELLSAKAELLKLMWRYLRTQGKISEFFYPTESSTKKQ